jgi:hypothetical protein
LYHCTKQQYKVGTTYTMAQTKLQKKPKDEEEKISLLSGSNGVSEPKLSPNGSQKKSCPQRFAYCSLFLNVTLILVGLLGQIHTLGTSDIATAVKKCSYNEEYSGAIQTTTTTQPILPNSNYTYTHSPVTYAHIHMAKTAGTEINGELAARFERVCGHKGYSFDSYGVNARNEAWKKTHPKEQLTEQNGPLDSINKKEYNRGRVPTSLMFERGFQDCDWISIEDEFSLWQGIAREVHPFPIEFHVPCRDPVEHLLSMCNYRKKTLDCNITDDQIPLQLKRCILTMDRFDDREKYQVKSATLKCFNPIPIEPYMDYMSTKLQLKRMSTPYVHRNTNRPRQKDKECLLQDKVLQQKVKSYLEAAFPIYRFCKTCVGSKDDLLASSNSRN